MNSLVIEKTANYFKQKGIVLPTISELQNPHLIDTDIKNKVFKTDKDAMDPANLFRVHWFNKKDHSNFSKVPEHIVLPDEFTGVKAKIIVNIDVLVSNKVSNVPCVCANLTSRENTDMLENM